MTTVSILKSPDYDNMKGKIDRLFQQNGGINSMMKQGDTVLIKPNLLAPPKTENEPVATHGAVILGIAEYLLDHNIQVQVGDSPAFATARHILKKLGVEKDLENRGVEIVEMDKPRRNFSGHSLDQAIDRCDHMINVPKLKVHCQMKMTLAVKNLFGCVTGKRKPYLHMRYGDNKNDFAELLVKIYDEIKPVFNILDGVIAMNEEGPRGGKPKNVGYLFASKDAMALDRVVIESIGMDYMDYRILKAGKELNIGEWDINNIQIEGEKQIPSIDLEIPLLLPISFSPFRIIKSTIKNAIIKRRHAKSRI